MNLILQFALFGLLAIGLVVCAAMLISLKKQIHTLTERLRKQQEDTEQIEPRLLAQFTSQLDELRNDLNRVEEGTGGLVPPTPAKSGLNLNKRSLVMKMSRHGEEAGNIAAALSLPRNEVDLMLKVQRIVLTNASEAAS